MMPARNSEGARMDGAKMDSTAAWTAEKLFRRRVLRFWGEQWRIWRLALDWTVWIYIALPALIIGGGLYLELWTKQPEWLVNLPLQLSLWLPFAAVVIGRLRTFVEDADVLFLLQKQAWSRKLLVYGALYTAAMLAPISAALYVLAAPSLIGVHGFAIGEALLLCMFTLVWAMVGAIWRNAIWRLGANFMLAAVYSGVLYLMGDRYEWLLLPICVGAAAAVVLMRIKLRAKGGFEADVQREHAARLAVTQLLLKDVIERKPVIKLSRPVILRTSKRLFRRFDGGTVLAEMGIKIMLRRMGLLRMWLGFAGVSAITVLLSPGLLKLIPLCLLPVPLFIWVQSHWRSVIDEAFVAQFPWKDSELLRSAELTRLWLVAPLVCLLGLLAGSLLWGAPGLLLALPLTAAWWGINKMLYPIILLNKNRR